MITNSNFLVRNSIVSRNIAQQAGAGIKVVGGMAQIFSSQINDNLAKDYGAVCTPDFFGYNKNLELQYRGKTQSAAPTELSAAMKLIATTGKGPKKQIPSMGCSIKWIK